MTNARSSNSTRPIPTRLLGVWAHPDDEAYLSAGLMARITDAGGTATVVTATRGEHGTDDPARFGRSEFAEFREGELRAALQVVGVTDVRFLGHRDGGCAAADAGPQVGVLEAVIREVRPDVVVTFGPDGITGHPDHVAVSAWTTEAWCRVGCGELWYATMTHDHLERHRELHDRIGIFDGFGSSGPRSVADDELVAAYRLGDGELARKRAALAAHASQTAGLAELMGEDVYRTWWSDEWFRRPTAAELGSCLGIGRTPARAGAVAP